MTTSAARNWETIFNRWSQPLGTVEEEKSENFRNDAHRALNEYFGAGNVTPGDKAFDIHENTYRVDADVVACIDFRHYYREANSVLNYAKGTALMTRAGKRITNFPNQQYDNGVCKNTGTQQRFKPMVRIFKKLSCEMTDKGIVSARPMKNPICLNVWCGMFQMRTSPKSTCGLVLTVALRGSGAC